MAWDDVKDSRKTWANVVWHIMKTGNTTHGALLCSLVQVVRFVIVRVILVGVLGVTVVHIGHDEVLVVVLKSVAIFVIFCIWRCTLYTPRRWQWTSLTVTDIITVNCAPNSLWDSCHKINRRFTDYHRFPLSISVESIFVVRSHNGDPTR